MDRFSSIYWWGNLGKLLRKQCQTSTKKSTCFASCFILFRAAAYRPLSDVTSKPLNWRTRQKKIGTLQWSLLSCKEQPIVLSSSSTAFPPTERGLFSVRGNIWRIVKTINYFWLRKYARIVVLGQYLFLEAHSCPRPSLSGNCSLLGTDNIVGQLSVHISSPNAK